MNFFKTKPRTPPDIVRGLRDAVNRLDTSAHGVEARRKVGQYQAYGFTAITVIIVFVFLKFF